MATGTAGTAGRAEASAASSAANRASSISKSSSIENEAAGADGLTFVCLTEELEEKFGRELEAVAAFVGFVGECRGWADVDVVEVTNGAEVGR